METPKPSIAARKAAPEVARALGHVRAQLRALPRAPSAAPIVVAVSGGPDSVALVGLLSRLRRSERLDLVIGHVDHGLRPTSASEAAQVVRIAGDLGMPSSVRTLALEPGPGLPARARLARRGALVDIAREVGSSVVALGHTATDQAETILLHLCRGAGIGGLAGMRALRSWTRADSHAAAGAWWRPLLAIDRDATRRIADALALPFHDDPTNLDPSHPRIRVRTRVLPELRAIRADVDLALARAATHAADAADGLDLEAARHLAARRLPARHDGDVPPTPSTPCWSTLGWAQLPRAVRAQMIRIACTQAGVAPDALFARTVEELDAALAGGGRGPWAWDLHPRRRAVARSHRFWVENA